MSQRKPSRGGLTGTENRRIFKPINNEQDKLVEIIDRNFIVFVNGPAGTGKTWTAIAKGVEYLLQNRFRKLVLIRPLVESGESLGHLPGDIEEKTEPYMKPFYDILLEYLTFEELKEYKETDVIEVVPTAYARGRTFRNSYVIIDESQNLSLSQLKLLLTRIGENSKLVFLADSEQSDIKWDKNGPPFLACMKKLEKIDQIGTFEFGDNAIVRHPLISRILTALQ